MHASVRMFTHVEDLPQKKAENRSNKSNIAVAKKTLHSHSRTVVNLSVQAH